MIPEPYFFFASLLLIAVSACTGGVNGGGGGDTTQTDEASLRTQFLSDCQNTSAAAVRKTVRLLLNFYGTTDCANANRLLAKATTLDLSGLGLETVSSLAGLAALQELRLDDNSGLIALDALATLPKLKNVSLNGTNILGGWKSLARIERLYLDRSNVTDPSILKPLCPALLALSLNDNQLTTLDGIKSCTALRELHVDGNGLTTLDGIANFSQLRVLRAERNRLTSIAPLSALSQLQYLSILHNAVKDLSPLTGLAAMQALDVPFDVRTPDQCPHGGSVANAPLNDYCSPSGG